MANSSLIKNSVNWTVSLSIFLCVSFIEYYRILCSWLIFLQSDAKIYDDFPGKVSQKVNIHALTPLCHITKLKLKFVYFNFNIVTRGGEGRNGEGVRFKKLIFPHNLCTSLYSIKINQLICTSSWRTGFYCWIRNICKLISEI